MVPQRLVCLPTWTWRLRPRNDSAIARDALLVRFHLSSITLGIGEADVMFLAPDVKRCMFPQCGATAVSGWLSAWLCFSRRGQGSCILWDCACGCKLNQWYVSAVSTYMSEVCEVLRETLVTLFTNLTFTASSSGMSGFSNITTHTHQWRPSFDRWAVELGQPYRKVLSLCRLHVWCKSSVEKNSMCFNGKQGSVFHLRSLINTNHSCKKNTAGTWCCEGKQPLKYQRNNPGIFS